MAKIFLIKRYLNKYPIYVGKFDFYEMSLALAESQSHKRGRFWLRFSVIIVKKPRHNINGYEFSGSLRIT